MLADKCTKKKSFSKTILFSYLSKKKRLSRFQCLVEMRFLNAFSYSCPAPDSFFAKTEIILFCSFNTSTTSFCHSCCWWTALVHLSTASLINLISSNLLLCHSLSSSLFTSWPRELDKISGSKAFILANSARTPTWWNSNAKRSGSFGFFAVIAEGFTLGKRDYYTVLWMVYLEKRRVVVLW